MADAWEHLAKIHRTKWSPPPLRQRPPNLRRVPTLSQKSNDATMFLAQFEQVLRSNRGA
jgi:hypothetical protein